MRRSKLIPARLAFFVLSSVLLVGTSPSHALRGQASTALSVNFSFSGTPTYTFSSSHDFLITQFSLIDVFKPVYFQGQLGKLVSTFTPTDRCWRLGIVAGRYWECFNSLVSPCPWADGQWRAFTFATAGFSAFTAVSARSTVNCPPFEDCLLGAEPGYVFLVDLGTGLPLQAETTRSFEKIPLIRTETVEGKDYIINEWAVIEAGQSHAPTVLRASSPTMAVHGREQVSLLNGLTTHEDRKRTLLIHAPEHIENTRRPLVRFYPDQLPRAWQSGAETTQVVSIRAVYRMDGSLESAETIAGSASARDLARSLSLEFIDDEEHRTEVFAVFEIGDEIRLRSALPVFTQCCCSVECIPDPF